MARGKRVIPAMGRTDTPFTRSDEIPWEDIERAIGVSFSEESRREIFMCGYIGIMHRNVARDGASADEVVRLRNELLHHCESLISIIHAARAPSGKLRDEMMETALHALAMSVEQSGYNLGHLLSQLASCATEIKKGLGAADLDRAISALDPEVVGLAHFIAACVNEAASAPARASPGYLSTPSAFEYRRWGVLLSPKRGHLAELASGVLGRTVTKAQVQHAFGKAREFGLIDRHEKT